MLLTRFVINQIQPFSTVFNCFKFNSTKVTNIQFNLFTFKAFSINSTVLNKFQPLWDQITNSRNLLGVFS